MNFVKSSFIKQANIDLWRHYNIHIYLLIHWQESSERFNSQISNCHFRFSDILEEENPDCFLINISEQELDWIVYLETKEKREKGS